jgi:hypothetical protein
VGLLDRIRRWIWRTEEAASEVEYGALEAMHGVEDELDERSHGKFYDALEKVEEESGELLERLHLDGPEPEPHESDTKAAD